MNFDSTAFSMGSPCSISSGYASEEQDNCVPEYDYSPICSDIEEDNPSPEAQEQLVTDSQGFDFSTLIPEDESNLSIPENDFTNGNMEHKSITQFNEFKENFLKCVFDLFIELSRHRTLQSQHDFASERTLYGLIKAFNADLAKQAQVTKIYKNILRCVFYISISVPVPPLHCEQNADFKFKKIKIPHYSKQKFPFAYLRDFKIFGGK